MRAFVVTGPRQGGVQDVAPPTARPGEVVVDVERVGVCGTDVEFYTGEMAYLHSGHAVYPLRLGHEWSGTVSALGPGVEAAWLGCRVTGDTMLGCGRCRRCLNGRQHVCEQRYEIGVRGGWPGALAEQLPVPATALHALPDAVDAAAGALVEPGGNALRAVSAAGADRAGVRLLVYGAGTIGLLATQIALSKGAEVHIVALPDADLSVARALGPTGVWTSDTLPDLPFDAVLDATWSADVPQAALQRVEPGGRVVYIGLAGTPSTIDTRALVLNDVTAIGVLSGSPVLSATISIYARGSVGPHLLIGATVGLEGVADVLAGRRPAGCGAGPKIQVDPRK